MSPRERHIQTLLFNQPDRIPLYPGEPREATLATWYTQGLPKEVDWRTFLAEQLGIDPQAVVRPEMLDVDFRMMPWFEEKLLEQKDGHSIVQDWKGNICEIADNFDVTYLRNPRDFVTRRWIRCPVECRADWEEMKTRYAPDAPARLSATLSKQAEQARQEGRLLAMTLTGPFWQMREWCGFEGLCMMMIEQPDLVDEMALFWRDFVWAVFERVLAQVVPDSVLFCEDMAYKAKMMISPEMVRRFCMPSWRQWSEQLRKAGCPLVDVDSDGFIGELIPLWIEAGFNVCEPIEVAALNDIAEFRRKYGRQMAYIGGVDKRAMAKGGAVIREELARLEPVIRDGGFIPSCDHGVPFDVSWPNYVDYCRLLAQLTGWL
ncbi:MAG: hypothetical protein GXY44_10155 [Phycisphaerales bacterium]|nr:hypothetical protein [Phycisphaerales bacterium]